MLKKKLILGLSTILGVGLIATGVSLGYVNNSYSNRFKPYSSTPQSGSTTDLINSYFAAAVNGSKLLYLSSFTHTTPLATALNISKQYSSSMNRYFSNMGYILIDDRFGFPNFDDKGKLTPNQPIWSTNVASLQFRSDLGSFLTGIAVGQFVNENQSYFLNGKDRETFKWATYGGMPYPSVTSFMGGFQKGINWFNDNIVPLNGGYKKIEQLFLSSGLNSNFANSFDTSGGNELITRFLTEGVDIIIPIAGPQTQQAVRIIKQLEKRTLVIGADSPMEEDPSFNSPIVGLKDGEKVGNNKIIQFSSIKDVENMVFDITKILNEGSTNPSNNLGGFGYSSIGDISNNGVGISDAGKEYFIRAIHNYATNNSINWDNQDTSNLESQYLTATQIVSNLEYFKKLNTDEYKVYYIPKNNSQSYASIPNFGEEMLPITKSKQEIEQWFIKTYGNNDELKDVKLQEIYNWIDVYKELIDQRKNFSLKNELTKSEYSKNKGLIKVVLQTPTSVLFDKSFLESCYIGLRKYWQLVGVHDVPLPPGQK